MQVLAMEMKDLFGHILFTILRFDHRSGVMRRIYSNRPEVNPVGGTKPITDSPWMQTVLFRGESYIGRTREDLKQVFFDHETLWAIGCESVLNTPVRWQGRVIGSINMLDRAEQYTDDHAPLACLCAQYSVPLLLD